MEMRENADKISFLGPHFDSHRPVISVAAVKEIKVGSRWSYRLKPKELQWLPYRKREMGNEENCRIFGYVEEHDNQHERNHVQ